MSFADNDAFLDLKLCLDTNLKHISVDIFAKHTNSCILSLRLAILGPRKNIENVL